MKVKLIIFSAIPIFLSTHSLSEVKSDNCNITQDIQISESNAVIKDDKKICGLFYYNKKECTLKPAQNKISDNSQIKNNTTTVCRYLK